MDAPLTLSSLSGTIQLALAPVFLFTGIAAFLSMLSLRLGRVIDRGRLLDSRIPLLQDSEQREALRAEAAVVWRRTFYINWSIRCAVFSALLICIVVICLFLAAHYAEQVMVNSVSVLFIAAMVFLLLSLSSLLIEVGVSTNKIRQRLEHTLEANRGPTS